METGNSEFLDDEIVNEGEDVDKVADLFSDLEASQSQSKPETDDKHEDDVDHSDEEDMFSEYETSQSQNKLEPSQVLSSSL